MYEKQHKPHLEAYRVSSRLSALVREDMLRNLVGGEAEDKDVCGDVLSNWLLSDHCLAYNLAGEAKGRLYMCSHWCSPPPAYPFGTYFLILLVLG